MTARLREVQLAFTLLTRLPVGRLPDPVPTLAQAAWAYPLVGLVWGAVLWAVLTVALVLGFSPMISGVAAIAAVTLLTGGLHFDGLADFADGIGGGRDRAHVLEIMHDSRIGSYGVLALVLVIGLTVSALAQLIESLTLTMAAMIGVSARIAMLGVMRALPPARADGLGKQTEGIRTRDLVCGVVIALALTIALGMAALLVLATVALTALFVARKARQRISGYTGDVLGATVVLCESSALLALILIP